MSTSAPAALAWSTDNCPVGRAMDILGESGTVIVLREIFNGVRRFELMQRHSGLSRAVLSHRLALLVEHGIVQRVAYREPGDRERHEYRLTQRGFDLQPVMVALADWGGRHLSGADGPAVEVEHAGCGARAHVALVCEDGHQIDRLRDVRTRPGPGALPFTP
ncbi:helix-turn-helix domain-containing protein [Aeromicrobium sp. Leaf350]|uniref:winged helix-turn-helix transcriptional regulator n=1 Tax=Aeromicrobium sp. Leaf350 TaxID=2876565 RepID=UPI001E5941B1|nr:helix-turn-helix domain-containing protein [Aeromicrobium sp. Leaf350]